MSDAGLLTRLLSGSLDAGAGGLLNQQSLSSPYDTPLTPAQMQAFRASSLGHENASDYDTQGAWLAGLSRENGGHLPDTYKKPNHMTFSNGSQYSTPETPGGEWVNSGNGWTFIASPYNVQQHSPQDLEEYFKTVEPDSILAMPLPPIKKHR